MRRASRKWCLFLRAGMGALVSLMLAVPGAVFAQGADDPTALAVGAPPTAELGQRVTLQARLVDSSGAPVSQTTIFFVRPSSFLKASADVVVARVTTDQEGLATAEYTVRNAEEITIRAEFRGSARYAPSRATASISVAGAEQLYTEHAGVQIPGLNAPPAAGATTFVMVPPDGLSRLGSLWPGMSGWPIGAALLVVWSCYVYVVVLIFRVAAVWDQPEGAPDLAGRRRP